MSGASSSIKSTSSRLAEAIEIFEIPIELFNPLVQKIFIYALSPVSIGVSTHRVKDWEEKAIWWQETACRVENEKVRVIVPQKLKSFYNFDASKLDVTGFPEKDLAVIMIDFVS